MSIGVGDGIELSATACTLLNNNKLGVSTYITTLKRTSLNSPYACIVYVRQANFTTKSRFKNLSSLICQFRVSPGLCMKTRLSAQAFDMKTIFHSHANKTYFHEKGCALSLIFKVRVLGTRKKKEENSHTQRKQMQRKLFTNHAWWWNLLVWRKHA